MIKESSSILDLVKKATVFDLFLITILALPVLIQAWISILRDLGNSPTQITVGVIVVIIAYIVGIVIMYAGVSRQRSRKLAKDEIVGYLNANKFTKMSFDRVRQKFGNDYSDSFLNSVIDEFPTTLRRATLKGNKVGVAVLADKEEDEEKSTP